MLDNLANLHKLCFPHKPWDADQFADLKKSGCEIIASQNGFIVYRAVCDEAEIITIGVHPDARRMGIGIALIGVMEADLKKQGVKHIFLDKTGENAELEIHGRHDPCILPRAVPVIEAMTAIAILELWKERQGCLT